MSSNIEPQTTAKCILYTTKGDIVVELWANECPETCKRFLTMLSDGAFVNGEFDELKPTQWLRFSATSTGEHRTVSQERNPRLRFNKDGLLGWDRQRNTWFITVQTDSKHVLNDCNVFGKIVGKSIYIFREILGGEIEALDDEVKQFVYPAVLKDFEITLPFFEDISTSKKRLRNSEEKEQQPKRKFMRPAKVKMIYEDEEEDDDVDIDIDVIKPKTKKRMILPACIKDESSSEIHESAMPSRQQQKPPITEQVELHKGVSSSTIEITAGQDNDNEEMIDKRELDTLEMLTKFQQRMKNKKILK